MRYTEPLSNQVLMFISSIGPGVLIGFIYDVIFSFFRALGDKKALTIAADLSFSLIATLISFFYMVIYNSGTVRLNIVLAQIIGAVTFHYTLGKYVALPIAFAANVIGKIFQLLLKPFKVIYNFSEKFLSTISTKLKNAAGYEKNKPHMKEKIINILKIHLKK